MATAHSSLERFWKCAASSPDGRHTDGDSDRIAAITGSILGARLGLHVIPKRWLNGVENSALLMDHGVRLSAARIE